MRSVRLPGRVQQSSVGIYLQRHVDGFNGILKFSVQNEICIGCPQRLADRQGIQVTVLPAIVELQPRIDPHCRRQQTQSTLIMLMHQMHQLRAFHLDSARTRLRI